METDQRQVMKAEEEHLEEMDLGPEENVQEGSWLVAGAVVLFLGGLAMLLSSGSGVGAFAGGMLIFLGLSFAAALVLVRNKGA